MCPMFYTSWALKRLHSWSPAANSSQAVSLKSENFVQAQCILFRRYPEVLAPFKYGGYPLLLNAVTLSEYSEESNAAHFLGTETAALVVICCN